MFRRWIASHKSLVATATSGSVVVALVVAVAVVSTGYTAQRLDLNDASVWVANGTDRFIGRANTEVFELNSVIAGGSADLGVVQRGSTVLMFDRGDATVDIVDAATSAVTDSVPLPPERPEVFLAGDNAVVYSQGTGGLWILPVADLAEFDAAQEPTLSLGVGAVVSVDADGLLFAFSPEARKVFRVDAATSSTVSATSTTRLGDADGAYAITSVNGRWAVLDEGGEQLEYDGGVVDLSDEFAGGNAPMLQQPSTTGDRVLVSYSRGLAEVALGSGDTRELYSDASGTPAAPAVVDGCAYAAWSGGEAWRSCAGREPAVLRLDAVPTAAQLAFAVNGSRIVLNDARSGASWAVHSDGQLIDNWDDLIAVQEDEQQVEQNDDNTPPEIEKDQVPPVAVDDAFGARPGRSTVVPVLLNDYDPNGDVLVVSDVTPIDPGIGRIDAIDNRQKLLVTLEPSAAGVVTFGYTVDDGRGGSASATVTVTVRAPGENSPPQQVRSTKATVESGGVVAVPVLDDWIDPDGDPFYLVSATAPSTVSTSFRPEGLVTVTDAGETTGTSVVTLVASDGTASDSGTLTITTTDKGKAPLEAIDFAAEVSAGSALEISPLDHVRGGNGVVRLNAVPAKTGVTITPSFETGTFRFESDQVRVHYVEYVVTDDTQSVTGLVRVTVSAPPDANLTPVTIPKTVFIPTLGSRTVDVAATDRDPAGGVLLVTGVTDLAPGAGVRAEVLEQRSVRVTLAGLLAAPVTFGYRVSNGLAEADGTITVIQVPPPAQVQPPIARDDTATARVGDAITIDVLGNDEQPDGEPITLNPKLVDGLDGDAGLLFASGNSLRYLAPKTTGNFTAVYEIVGPLGQTAQAQVTIEVREPNEETNRAPVAETVVARVLAGEHVRIDVPLDGIDPDGDSVQLLGQESNPEKGSVASVTGATIDYEAGAYSAGTDTFTYTVMDSLGARATGSVRVGISPKTEAARNPVAIEDEVSARPGATVSVQVLANDSDPGGSALRVVSVQPNDENLTATIDGASIVDVTAPSRPGVYGLVYSIENDEGGSSSNFVTVVVSAEAPLAYPLARDTVLTLSDVLDRSTITVDVLANVFFADGDASDLDLAIVPGYDGTATVTAGKKVRVTIGDERQIIPFAVSHPDDAGARSYAFIWVPGYKDALPQLNRNAPKLQVVSEESITIDLADYVLAVDGKRVRLTDSSTVRATHSNGASLVVDSDTLRFTSADLYFGPASISFEVTDGTSASDPAGRKANLVLPITVKPRQNQPPVFTGATIDFEPGQEKTIDLTNLTNYPYDDDLDELDFSVGSPAPTGFAYQLSGQTLTVRADESAAKNSSTTMSVGVRDAVSTGQPGRIQLRVIPSTRPLAVPATDTAVARRGQSTTIDVLANDEATNPFPGKALRVVAVRGLEGGSLPAGVTVTASADNRTLTASVSSTAAPSDAVLQYQVSDASRDPDRYVWGTVRVSVQDVPDAPAKPTRQADSFVGGELRLRFVAPQQNNSQIVDYRVTSKTGNYAFDCGTALICSLPGLTVGASYAFQVTAVNAVGESQPSPASDVYTVDYLPAAPDRVTAVPSSASDSPGGGSIDVSWTTVPRPEPGTAVVDYVVEVNGTRAATVAGTSTTIGGLPTNTAYSVVVFARNAAQVISPADWRRSAAAAVTTVGPPIAPGAPVATTQPDGDIQVTWGAFDQNGPSPVGYSVRRLQAGEPAPTACVAPTASGVSSGWLDTGGDDGATYRYAVFADNGRYCTVSVSGEATSLSAPGPATGEAVVADNNGSGQFDVRAGALSVTSGTAVRYEYRLNGGAWAPVVAGQWLTGADATLYGSAVGVQFRGCRDASATFCGPESGTTTLTPVSTRAGIAACVVGAPPAVAPPGNIGAGGSPVTVTYMFAYRTQNNPTWSTFNFTGATPVPATALEVRVQSTVTIGGVIRLDPGFGQGTCG